MRIAVLIPCYNEAMAIGEVVRAFRSALPEALIHVYDNNSTDGTAERAAAAGAIVRRESLQGKGYVVRRMFADIEADFYVLADGDATYDAAAAPALLARAVADRLDMVNAARMTEERAAYRPGHRLGNRVLTGMVTLLFGRRLTDMLSGYRVFSRRFVKSFPAMSAGFEIETELTVHALQLDLPIAEMRTVYRQRLPGSFSALRTYRDGVRILGCILRLIKQERPHLFFGMLALCLCVAGLGFGLPVIGDYWRTGLVPRLPTAVLATGLMILAALSFFSGLILDTVAAARLEARRLAYLRLGAPGGDTLGEETGAQAAVTGS